MSPRPQVSVVVPTHNRCAWLALTLDCVVAQQGVDWECIVVDDGSTDATAAAVSACGDDRIRLVRNPQSHGVARARNRGIAEANGEWIAFLDDDDLWAPDKLTAQLSTARPDTGWSYVGAVAVDATLRVVANYPGAPPEVVRGNLGLRNEVPAGASNVVVRASVLEEVGGFDDSLHAVEDWDLWLRIGRVSAPAWVDRPLLAYRLHRGNRSLDVPALLAEGRLLEQRYGVALDWAAMHRWMGWSGLRAGRRRQAATAFLRAARAGDAKSLLRAVNALVHPQAGRRTSFRPFRPDADPLDAAYTARAQEWISQTTAARASALGAAHLARGG